MESCKIVLREGVVRGTIRGTRNKVFEDAANIDGKPIMTIYNPDFGPVYGNVRPFYKGDVVTWPNEEEQEEWVRG